MIAAIVAVDENWGIGRNGDLLINIPEDKKFFKERTNGSIVIMGRKTWDSLPKKPLPNRKNYVISKSQKHVNGVDFISMDSAIELIQNEDSDIFIIGGGQIYEKLMNFLTSQSVMSFRVRLSLYCLLYSTRIFSTKLFITSSTSHNIVLHLFMLVFRVEVYF